MRWGMRPLRFVVILFLVAVVVVGIRHINAGSQTYTGCLNSKGAVSRVQIGTAPTKACDGLTQVSWDSDPPAGSDGADGADGAIGLEGQSCPEGEALAGFDESGEMICAVP